MCQVQKGCLLVVEGARPVGILTEWDLIHKVLAKDLPLDELEVSKVMTKELISVQPEAPVSEAAKLIVKHGVHRLVVMDDGNVVGLLSTTDLAGILVR
jgi:CBS domain-containing protein